MKSRATVWLTSAVPFLAFGALSWKLPSALGLSGTWRIAAIVALLLLGLAASAFTLLLLKARLKREPQVEGGAEIDEAMAAASARLKAANLAADGRLSRLPLALVLGPTGSTKTSVIMHSGLDPELLAGEVLRGDTVIATEPLNVWYAHGMVLVEAGGRMLEDAARWRRLVGHLAPRRLAAALGRGRQAPRSAVLCFACDDFVKPGASQNLHTLARQLRARLTEASQQLGIRLPVYVLFTRADRLPFFADFVRSFSGDEAEQVLGATLPLVRDTGASWAEHESRRLNEAFARMVRALSLRRLDLLPRETQEALRANAYEFPRELRKITEPAVQLLIDIFRPSQLGVNPFLRGFYFTGVRPVILRDVASDAGLAPRPAAALPNAAATSVFSVASLQGAAPSAAPSGGGRKVPQWVFLPRVFRDVMLRDELALSITGSGTRVDLLRRTLIGAAAAACLLLGVGFTVAFAGNRSLMQDGQRAALLARDANTAAPEQLALLDSLRAVTARAADIDRSFSPGYHWGLYRGDHAYQHLRGLYFERFRTALWNDARGGLVRFLSALPPRPDRSSDFGLTQRAFLAYRLTTDRPERSTAEDLRTPLLEHWLPQGTSDSLALLAGRQFAFFGAELPYGRPYPEEVADPALVTKAQDFLLNFGGDVYYDALVASLNDEAAARFEGSEQVSNGKVVPGAFTFGGLRRFESQLDSVEAILSRYLWLYDGRTPADKPNEAELQRRYYQDYIDHWQDYIRQGRVRAFAGLAEAARGLQVLGGAQSPLFEMLRLAAYHTNMPATHAMGRAFPPLHALVPPGTEPGLVTTQVGPYTDVLVRLAAQASAAAGTQQPPLISGDELRTTVGTLVTTKATDPEEAQTAEALRTLLFQPAENLDRLAKAAPKVALNGAGRNFCSTYGGIGSRLPFSAGATQSASAADVFRVFGPGEVLSSLYDRFLRDYLTEGGAQQPGAEPLSPAFTNFYRAAIALRAALYPSGASAPQPLQFSFEPPPGSSVRLEIDGNRMTWSAANREDQEVRWQPERAQSARLILITQGQETVVAAGSGPFGLFGLFHAAGAWSGTGPYEVEWSSQGRTLVGRISMPHALRAVLQRGRLDPLRYCVGNIIN